MVISTIKYAGQLSTEAKHLKSGKSIVTDAPLDNEGKGDAFSPTDLLSTSLAACMFTLMGITANKHGFAFEGAEAEVGKVMLSNPRRVGQVSVKVSVYGRYNEKQMKLLETAALNCPVAKSLHPDIEQLISFQYPDL